MAHQFTPTYPKLEQSYMEGILKAEMLLINFREDVRFFTVEVYDSDWKKLPFATVDKVLEVRHLDRRPITVYVRQKDDVRYICTRSETLVHEAGPTTVASKICSKVQ